MSCVLYSDELCIAPSYRASLVPSLTLPPRLSFAALAASQCLKCFRTFALHNKVKILIPLPASASFSLNDPPRLTDEEDRVARQRCQAELLP